MSEIIDIITRLNYVAEDEGLKKSVATIDKLTNEVETLTKERVRLGEVQSKLAAKDMAQQKQVIQQMQQVEKLIRQKAKAIIDERVASSSLNKEIVKEIGLVANLNQKMDALKNKHAMVQTEKEVKAVNREIKKLQGEIDTLNGKAGAGGGLMGNLLGAFGIGTGIGAAMQAFSSISGFISDSISEFEDADKTARQLERTLGVIGQGKYFKELIAEADELQVQFHGLFDNDDIIKAQTALVQYGKLSRNELSKLTPVILELATAEGIDLVQATEKVIAILEGRGAATLREYGLNIRNVKSEHDRLNLILGEFQTKLKGSADLYAQTAAGIKQQNEIILADTKEKIGERLLPIYVGFLRGLSDLVNGEFTDLTLRLYGRGDVVEGERRLKARTDAAAKARFDEITANRQNISHAKLQLEIAGLKNSVQYEYLEQLQKEMELKEKDASRDAPLNKNAMMYEEVAKQDKKASDKKKKTQAELDEEFARRTEKEFQDTLKMNEEFNQKQLFELEKLKQTGALTEQEYNDLQIERQVEHFAELVTLYTDYGKDVYKIRVDQLKALEELEKRERAKTKARIEKEGPVTGDFIPGTTGAIEIGADASVLTKEGEAKRIQDGKDQVGRNKTLAESYAELNLVIQGIGDAINTATQAQIDNLDREINAQQRRIDRAVKYAERGGAELLEQEEERLAKLEERREKFARRQLIINNALALSNAILAVATTASQSGVTSVATIPAVLAAIAAGYAFATSLTEPQSFAEGTKSVEGPGTETSDSIPARLSRGERVMPARRSRQFKPVLDDIQDGKFKSIEDLYSQIRTGQYSFGMNYAGAIESRTGVKEFSNADVVRALGDVKEAIEDKPVGQMYADENGLHMRYIKFQQREIKRGKY